VHLCAIDIGVVEDVNTSVPRSSDKSSDLVVTLLSDAHQTKNNVWSGQAHEVSRDGFQGIRYWMRSSSQPHTRQLGAPRDFILTRVDSLRG